MTGTASFDIQGEQLLLLPQHALFWKRQHTLMLADPHFGKPEAFRSAAIPVPDGTTARMLGRLEEAIFTTRADRLMILGDFWHSRSGRSQRIQEELAAWRQRFSELSVELVLGNHDRRAGGFPEDWKIVVHPREAFQPPFVYSHFPVAHNDGYVLAGHIHPAVRLTGFGRQRLRLPCFWFGANSAVLPAFGDFTGLADIKPIEGDRVFVVAGNEVVAVNADSSRG